MTRILQIALLIALTTGCGKPADDEAPTRARVERRDLFVNARATGELRAVRSEDLVTPASRGRLQIAMLVPDGKKVKAGELLLTFDPSEVQKELRDRQADLGTKRKELEKGGLDGKGEIEKLQVDLERTRVALDKARILARSDVQLTKSNDIKKAQADVTSLTVALREKQNAIDLARERHTRRKRSLEAYIDWAESAVELAEDQLKAVSLTAPVDGTALINTKWSGGQERKFQVGDTGWQGQAVVSIPDLSEMEAVMFVEEADISRIEISQTVTITLDAAPDREFKGKVKSIPPLAERLSWSNPAKVFRIIASVDENDPDLMRPGLRLQAEIELERYEDVLTVPIDLVAEQDGKTYLELARGGRAEVALGARDDSRVIVASGLEEGVRLAPRGRT